MTRREFSDTVRRQAFARSKGHCEKCSTHLYVGKFAYDHVLPDWLGGTATLDNCQVLCDACHGEKTSKEDVPRITKTKRQHARHIGKARSSRAFPPPQPRKPASTPLLRPLPPRRFT